MYAEALLHKANTTANTKLDEEEQHQSRPQTPSLMVAGSFSKRFGSYLSDEEDNESFVSADSVCKFIIY